MRMLARGTILVAALATGVMASAQTTPVPQQPTSPTTLQPTPPATQKPTSPAGQQPAAPGAAGPAAPVAPLVARTFTAPTGVIFHAVRPERVVDFELVIGYLQAALAKSSNAQVGAQAKGWRVFKATEPGPNGTVLYMFLLDPAVSGTDYALGPILSDAFPDQIEQIWKLYQGALAGAGSQTLLNLTPVKPPPLPPTGPGPAEPAPVAPRSESPVVQ
jgi:hypothetical protein